MVAKVFNWDSIQRVSPLPRIWVWISGEYCPRFYNFNASGKIVDGGSKDPKPRYVRLLSYNIDSTSGNCFKVTSKYIVNLQAWFVSQSEIHYISDSQFLFLPQDADAGRIMPTSISKLRKVDVSDIIRATNIIGMYENATGSIETEC